MGPRYLMDSNVVIAYLDDKLTTQGAILLDRIVNMGPNISVITKIEVLRFDSVPSAQKMLENFITDSNVISLSSEVVEQTISVCKGRRIKLPDAIIAATAIFYGFILVTRNISDFKKIPGLSLLDPWDEAIGEGPIS